MKNISIIAVIIIYTCFAFFVKMQKSLYNVLEVISPVEIIVDFNKNGVKDNNETYKIDDILSFSTRQNQNLDLIKTYNISGEDAIRIGFLAENFAKNYLEGKRIKIVDNDIEINNNKYSEILIENGFAVKKGKDFTSAFFTNLDKAKKLNLVILNQNNNKYHNLNCKYGHMAKNFIIIPITQLPKGATPCTYCKNDNLKKKEAVIKTPNLSFKKNNIDIFLTDLTSNLKPKNDCSNKLCKALINEINSSKKSIDFAIYGYTKIPKIEQALLNAKARGVIVRFVFDTDLKNQNIYPDTFYLSNLIKDNKHDNLRSAMHNKFFIFDDKKVFTGSANITNTDMSGYSSNTSILIDSDEIAKIYKKEFEQMYMGKFSKNKSIIEKTPDLRVYFSPADTIIESQIIPLINTAKKYIYIPAFVITHENFAKSLISAKKRGVDVKIILDATNTKTPSKISVLRSANIPVKTENYAGKLHSKTILIDDEYLIIGSMNFSKSGEMYNDENIVILKDNDLTRFYKEFFLYLWAKIPDKWLKFSARAESQDSIGSCSDGIDNDFDGDIDSKDNGCQTSSK